MASELTGKQVFMESLLAHGVDLIFGNPGTTELPVIESLRHYPRVRYVMALQEAVAVSMADAYAHARGSVAVANLHVAPGLGNGLGSLYNAWEGQTPLIVTAGQQDTRLRLREPLLGHDLVAMATPLVKWSVEAQSADEMALIMHRAFKTAREAPSGPVFVSLPMNVMEGGTRHPAMAPSTLYPRGQPDPAGVAHAAGILLGASDPVIVFGDKVGASGALEALVALAEKLGARVFGEVLPSRMSFPNQHPAFRGRLGQDQRSIRQQMDNCDAVVLVGGEFFEEIWFADEPPFPAAAKRIQIDPSARHLGRNYRVDCGLLADPRQALEALVRALDEGADDTFQRAAAGRGVALRALKSTETQAQLARARVASGNRPMTAARLMAELAATLPGDVAIAGEAITAGLDLMRTLSFQHPDDYLAARGGGIGQGLPSAIGMKLAHPERPVLCLSGDGSALYTIQSLWSAAHHDIPVVFLIINNRSYRILKLNMNRYRTEAGLGDGDYPHLDLDEPPVDFVHLAKGFGVAGRRIEAPEEIGPAVRTAFDSGEPWLLDVAIDGRV